MKQIKVIGVGGVTTSLLPFLARYLNFEAKDCRITLIDGDEFELKNASRQAFQEIGNKAKVKARELAHEFQKLSVRSVAEFVTPDNIERLICDGDIVLMGVDNHRTRKLVSDHCETLKDITLISGGNELTDGNVQVFIKKHGKEITVPITMFHPEIQDPEDKNPGEMSCQERAQQASSRQILVTNMGVAWLMFVAFWLSEQGKLDKLGEFYFDIIEGKVQRVDRKKAKG